jgi:hypothetical protein
MAWINEEGYIETCHGGKPRVGRHTKTAPKRDWWLVNTTRPSMNSTLKLTIIMPQKYYGKRVKLKVEVIEDDNKL